MDKTYYTTIGLEIHAEMNTKRKMFCDCINDPFHSGPNQNICPVCMAHPGTMPVPNKQAIENVIRVGLAINANIANFSEFDRKNYFYPDIPKGYQISQYKYPIVSGGHLAGVDITRIHLEEDTATSKHSASKTLIDYNRAGVPLMELVTEPCIHSPEDAAKFGRELQLLLQYLGVSEANMEKGEMRVELNLSISPDKDKFGTKVEVKNINSFSAVERAAKFEIERMKKLYEAGKEGEIVQETRGWDEVKQQTFSQRAKENANDYRYFPEPDIPKFYLHDMFNLDELKGALPELPSQKRDRYKNEYGIKDEDIESFVYDRELSVWFESVAKILTDKEKIKTASNYITSDYLGIKKSNPNAVLPSAENFAELIELLAKGDINSRTAKDILLIMTTNDQSPLAYAQANDLIQKNDPEALKAVAMEVIEANPAVIETYKGGKENVLMSLVGQIMKKTNGSANPQMALEITKELIK
ncbi:MAG: Asp-tRNA(Asn)/Glu-tRNA(Gln) amidotransferase subunit GatB [Candidatus Pacebacteria bacterium]|nr:Asp-tRNA(Asn)/Glu-tRNA(Gln) amidotransferase subunit GatB [Candidatus Paceibacterota bacterium]